MDIFRRIRKSRYFCYLLLLAGCDNPNLDRNFIPEGFVTEIKLKFTPVRDQGRSELCWVYAMYGVIETEYLMKGDSIDLSPDYAGRVFLEQQAREYYLSGGKTRMSLRGVGPMALVLGERYGILQQRDYSPSSPVDFSSLVSAVKHMADEMLVNSNGDVETYMTEVSSLLDKHIGAVPDNIDTLNVWNGKMSDSYVTLMSNKKKAYGKTLDPELTDNRFGCLAKNVSPDSLSLHVKTALEKGNAVMWEGGPNDNHAVVIVGMGHDKKGKRYFVAKNSWGTNNPTRGFLFIPESYLKKHTALVVMKK